MQNQDAQLYLCECFLVDLHAPPASTHECSSLPKLAFNTDPACIAFRSLSAFRYPGSAQRLGAGGAG